MKKTSEDKIIRIVCIFGWGTIFFLGSSIILGILSVPAIVLAILLFGVDPESSQSLFIKVLGISWVVIPFLSGILSLILGICGKLPGTGHNIKDNKTASCNPIPSDR